MLITLMLLVLGSFFSCRVDKMRCRSEKRVFLDRRLSSDEKVYLLVCCCGRWSRAGGCYALQLAPPQNGRALGDTRACLACKCTRVPLFYLEKKKERKKKSAVFSSRHKVFLWLRAAGCGPVRAGQRRGSLGEKGRIWLIIYQCQPHNDSPCSPPIDEDNYISSE